MEVKLIVVGGKNAAQAIPVAGPKFFIGRSDDCHLRPQSDLVSRHHCVLLVEEGLVAVRDFGSRNGTLVNGERIKAEQELKNGDRLKVGPLEFEVQVTVPVGGKKKPKVHSVQEAAARTVQSAKPADDEMDVSDWLEDEAQPSSTIRSADTQPITMAPTTDSVAGKDAVRAKEEPKKEEGSRKKKEEKHKIVGQFHRDKKPTSDSSGDAAADVLKQLFGRKY